MVSPKAQAGDTLLQRFPRRGSSANFPGIIVFRLREDNESNESKSAKGTEDKVLEGKGSAP